VAKADLIVIQRNTFGNVLTEMLMQQAAGKTIAVDVDDYYQGMGGETGSASFDFWRNSTTKNPKGETVRLDPPPLESLEWGVKLAGNLTAPSRVLCDDWAGHAVTHFQPNYLDHALYWRGIRPPTDKIRIGFGGSFGHLEGFRKSNLGAALRMVLRERKDVVFDLAGDERILHGLGLPPGRWNYRGWFPLTLWAPNFLAGLDIGLIPLAGEYDRRRSALKSTEMAMMGLPWIGSNLEPNQLLAETGVLVENTAEAWHKAIMDMINDLPAQRALADMRRAVAMNMAAQNNVSKILSVYEAMLA
jgi:hypothetical protein